MATPPSDLVRSLARALGSAVERAAGPGPCSVLYSGGLDSTIVAHAARSRRPTLVAVGVAGSHDLGAARSGAAQLGQPIATRELTDPAVRAALDRWAKALGDADATARAVTLGIALGLEASAPGVVICGQGADELFLGYAHFRGLDAPSATARREEDLDRLLGSDWPRAQRIAAEVGRDLRSPYLDPEVVDAVLGTDVAFHLPADGTSKPTLRAVAREMGVPLALALRPKKALQYGSGIARVLTRLDRVETAAGGLTPL